MRNANITFTNKRAETNGSRVFIATRILYLYFYNNV